MPLTCNFAFDRSVPIYYSGETINYQVLLNSTSEKNIKAIFVTTSGEAICKWRKGDNGATKPNYEKQQLLYNRVKVFEGANLSAGEHIYNLSMLLPNDCPSTCAEKFGHISYEILVELERPLLFDKRFRTSIIVYQSLDLNARPECKFSVKYEDTKFLCRWPCRSGPILSSIVLPHMGYVPGQNLSFVVNVDNQSQYDTAGLEVFLLQHFIFWVNKPTNSQISTIKNQAAVINESTLRLSKRVYESSIVIPQYMQRSTLSDKYIVSLHYELQVKLKIGLFHKDIVMTVPIVIGTIPLPQCENRHALVTMQPSASTGQSRSQCDSIQISNNDRNDGDNNNFPSYTSSANARQSIYANVPLLPGNDTVASRTQAEDCYSYPDWD